MRTSDVMLKLLGDLRPKNERMISWATQHSTEVDIRALIAGKKANELHAKHVIDTPGGIHESLALPILLTSDLACRVFLDTNNEVRYERVARRENVDLKTARLITTRKDDRTNNYMQHVYGLGVSSPDYWKHFEVVINSRGEIDVRSSIPLEIEQLFRVALADTKRATLQ